MQCEYKLLLLASYMTH